MTRKIEKWHNKFGTKKMHKEFFARDEEFIELDNSPTKFETSSEEEGIETDSPVDLKDPSDSEVRINGKGSALAQQSESPVSPDSACAVTKQQSSDIT